MMGKLYKILALFLGVISITNSYSQIFTESIGNVGGTTTIAAHETANGFDNDSYTMTGTGDIRNTTPSAGYAGASGNANVFITNVVGRDFQIADINTAGCTMVSITHGMHKSTTASDGSELICEVSSDGTTYTPLTASALPTGAGTATWHLRTCTGAIPATANLRIRFRQTSTTPLFRIDDIILNGTCHTITTSAVLGSPFTVTCTSGTTFNVDFTSTGTYSAGNVYSAEISDNTGSFISPTVIGTLSSTANSGTIACALSPNYTTGTLYRIRVVSSTPSITGTDNGSDLTVSFSGPPCGVTTGAIAGSPFTVTCSTGIAVNVPFTSVGNFVAGNVYTAQLSDAAGSFAIPMVIGTLTSTANSGTINATIPAATAASASYRIRVVSSSPFYTGSDNGTDLTINLSGGPCTVDIITGAITGSPFTVTCLDWENTDVPFTATGFFNAGNVFRAQLSDASGSFTYPITIGQISLSGSDPASTIPSTIFAGLTPSANYRIRVISTNPATNGTDNGVDLTVNNAGSPCYGPIIMNEMSQGGSGNKEYMELLVIANDPCATMDIRNFIIDDNNGDFSSGASSGAGIAAGHMRFTNADQWANVPSGSLIVIYNAADVNGSVPADDPSDLIIMDKVYVLPSNSSLLEGCVTRPTSTDNSYSPCVYGVGNWNYVSLANGVDAAQVRYPNGIYSHGFSWGTATAPAVMDGGPDNLLIGTTGTSSQNISFMNSTDNDYTLDANYARGAVPTDETPGEGNSAANSAFIATLICTALPVDLVDFNVIKQERFNYIFWSTSSEINTGKFIVERSVDMVHFIEIAELDAAGNSSQPRNYSCSDDYPVPGYSYYRLKMVDLNGETEYSQARMVYRTSDAEMPTLLGTTFNLNVCENGSLIKIYDAAGRLIEQKTITTENYDIQHLQNGFYLVQILCNRTEYIFKTSIQK